MTSVIHIVGSIVIALGIASLMMNANYQMSIDQAETVVDSQVQGDAEILKSVLREEFKQIGVDVPTGTDIFQSASSNSDRVAFVTATGGTLRLVELFTQTRAEESGTQTLRLMRRETTLLGDPIVTLDEIPIRGLIQLNFTYWSNFETQTSQPNNNTLYIGFDLRLQSTETVNGKYVGSTGSDRVILRSVLYRES